MSEIFLVTGATGFIGANMVRRLISEGKDVHVITRNKKLNWRLSDIAPKIKVHEISLLDPGIQKIVREIKPDYIFHLAAYGSLPHEESLDNLIDVNLKGTANLIRALKQNKFKLLINTGSSSEYGVKDELMRETDLPFPVNDYGVIKTATTLYAYKEAIRNSLPIITFRLFSTYGPYEEKTRFVPSVICSSIKNNPILVSSRKHVRDFIYVDDVVDAYLHACSKKPAPGEIFNIGTGLQYNIGNVVDKIVKISDSKSEVLWGKVSMQKRQVESGRWQADTTKTVNILKWKARYDLDEGLRKTVEWFRKNSSFYD